MNDAIGYHGRYAITARDASTGALLRVWHLDNQLTAISQEVRAQMLLGTYTGAPDALAIKYIAFGTNATPATPQDTRLGVEVLRKQVTQLTRLDTATVQSIVSLAASEGNMNIREVGVFCGPNATGSANTGTLLSRVVVDITKNSNMVLNVVRSDICTI